MTGALSLKMRSPAIGLDRIGGALGRVGREQVIDGAAEGRGQLLDCVQGAAANQAVLSGPDDGHGGHARKFLKFSDRNPFIFHHLFKPAFHEHLFFCLNVSKQA